MKADPPQSTAHTAAQTRVIEAAVALFGRHGIGGTSLQMIADSIGVTKAAVYHQYRAKQEIVLAVAEAVMGGLDEAVTAAERERSRARARKALLAHMIELAVVRRKWAGVLQRDPVMLRCLQQHARFRLVMERVNRVLLGGARDARSRVLAATLAAAIGASVIHPLVADLDDETLRDELWRHIQKMLPDR
jgi:AcrR family transcriptional regulator